MNNNRGFSLLGQLIMVGIIAVVAMTSSIIFINSHREVLHEHSQMALVNLRANLTALLRNNQAWNLTMQANPNSFLCIPTGCDPDGTYPIEIVKDAADDDYQNLNLNQGFTSHGLPCTFLASSPSSCPFFFEVVWSPLCKDAACIRPSMYRIRFDLKVRPSVQMKRQINLTRYSSEFDR